MELSAIFTPLTMELSLGGVGGFLVGYAVKKIAKVVAVLIGLFFLGLQYLSYKGVINVDYTALDSLVTEFVGGATATQNLVTDLIIHAPFGAAFSGGFYLGVKKG